MVGAILVVDIGCATVGLFCPSDLLCTPFPGSGGVDLFFMLCVTPTATPTITTSLTFAANEVATFYLLLNLMNVQYQILGKVTSTAHRAVRKTMSHQT